jgi:hypothetical protein
MDTCEAVFDARQTALNAGAATRAVVEERAMTARLFLLFVYLVDFSFFFFFFFSSRGRACNYGAALWGRFCSRACAKKKSQYPSQIY